MSLFFAYIYIKYIQIKILPFCLRKNFICNKPLHIIKNTTIALFLKELRKNCLQKKLSCYNNLYEVTKDRRDIPR